MSSAMEVWPKTQSKTILIFSPTTLVFSIQEQMDSGSSCEIVSRRLSKLLNLQRRNSTPQKGKRSLSLLGNTVNYLIGRTG